MAAVTLTARRPDQGLEYVKSSENIAGRDNDFRPKAFFRSLLMRKWLWPEVVEDIILALFANGGDNALAGLEVL